MEMKLPERGLDIVSIAVDAPRLRERFNDKLAHYKPNYTGRGNRARVKVIIGRS